MATTVPRETPDALVATLARIIRAIAERDAVAAGRTMAPVQVERRTEGRRA